LTRRELRFVPLPSSVFPANACRAVLTYLLRSSFHQPVEVSSISALSLSTGVPSAETTKLPELRYNLRYICDSTKVALDALAREGLSVAEKKRWLVKEDENLRHRVSEEAKSEFRGFLILDEC
jgi:hypothetical protein